MIYFYWVYFSFFFPNILYVEGWEILLTHVWKAENNLWELVLSFLYVGSGDLKSADLGVNNFLHSAIFLGYVLFLIKTY